MTSETRRKAEAARAAFLRLQAATDEARRQALTFLADALEKRAGEVEEVNARDVKRAEAEGLEGPLLKRLAFKGSKIAEAAEGVRDVAGLPDPVGETVGARLLDDGLKLYEVRVPLGVVLCAFESRPDVVAQVSALALRSGNAVLLKGGREAAESNALLSEIAREAARSAGLPADAVQLVEDRAELTALLAEDDLIDLVIPRGSTQFVKHVQSSTRIPVLGHAEGVCHVYVDQAADLGKALDVCVDAKVDYPAACNAAECFLVHRDVADAFVPRLKTALAARDVVVHESADKHGVEFGALACALLVVDSLEDAIAFVNAHGSKHTDAIVTEDADAARRFVAGVDTAGAYVNASTRFADGYRYGLGAEVGISTGKIHARGPVGLSGLTTTKWVLVGEGHTAGAYQGENARPFKHEALSEAWRG